MQPQHSCIPTNMRVGSTFWKTFVSCSLLTTWIRKCALIGRERLRPQSVEACGVVVRPRAIRGSKHQLLSYELDQLSRPILQLQYVWTRKRRKGTRKGRRQASPKDLTRQHPRNHEASHPSSGSPRWCQTYLWTHLRRNPRSPQGLPRERDQRCSHRHRARQAQDCHRHGRRLRFETPRTYLVRIRRLNARLNSIKRPSSRPHILKTSSRL